MWCDRQFSKFDTRIKLDASRAARIDSAVQRFADFCARDPGLRNALSEPAFLQGSVPNRTAIRPLGNDEYDVDVIYPFRLSGCPSRAPADIFPWFVERVRQDEWYRGRMDVKNRCVRINYAGDFHIDIIPSTADVGSNRPYAVPTRDLQGWITNDPRGFVDWVKTRDRASGLRDADGDGVLVRSIRMMKRWRDQFFGTDARPSSILLTTILGKHEASQRTFNPPLPDPRYPSAQHDAAYLFDLLRLTHSCIQRPESAPFNHPTIAGEDLRRGWDTAFQRQFLDRLAASIDAIGRGISATSDPEAARHYQKAFGETFPLE